MDESQTEQASRLHEIGKLQMEPKWQKGGSGTRGPLNFPGLSMLPTKRPRTGSHCGRRGLPRSRLECRSSQISEDTLR